MLKNIFNPVFSPALKNMGFRVSEVSKSVTRNFITFSSLDGGHAISREDIPVLAGDKIIIESQLYDSPHMSGYLGHCVIEISNSQSEEVILPNAGITPA